MKSSAIVRIVLYSAVVILLTAILVIGINNGSDLLRLVEFPVFSLGDNFDDTSYIVSQEGTNNVVTQTITDVEIDWTSGDIEIVPTDADVITFSEKFNSGKADDDNCLRYEVSGTTLSIRFSKSKAYELVSSGLNKTLTISLPKEGLEKLEADLVSADIKNTGVSAKVIDVDTTSGEVFFSDITADSSDINTVSGDVNFKNCTLNSIDIDSTSAALSVSGSVSDKIDMNTVSGEMFVSSLVCPKSLSADSTSGSLTLCLPADSGFTCKFDSVSGDFNSSLPTSVSGGNYICGNGASRFDFSSVSGDVSLSVIG